MTTVAAPFKENVGPVSVAVLAAAVRAVDPAFPVRAFCHEALDGLAEFELKARVRHVAGALDRNLKGRFGHRVYVVVTALDDAARRDELDWWTAWPAVEFVGAAGLGHPGRALDALGAVTRHASAEFAVRPYLVAHEELAWEHVWRWADSADAHRRRLASEGTRPRLPWGARVKSLLVAGRTVPLLDRLREDPSEEVRRSVANHLNDVARDHPDLAVSVAARWVAEGSDQVRPVVRNAMRGLVRAGHLGALDLLGIGSGTAGGSPPQVEGFEVSPSAVVAGEAVTLAATVRSPGSGVDEQVLVQYAVAGPSRRKVYFLGERTLPDGAALTIRRKHQVRHTTTRTLETGPHTVELLLNGVVRASAPLEVG